MSEQNERQPPTPDDSSDRQPPTPDGGSDMVPRSEMERAVNGLQKRLSEMAAKVKDLESSAPDLESINRAHAEALAAKDAEIGEFRARVEQAHQEVSFTKLGIDDDKARDFMLYEYGKTEAGEDGNKPAFDEWARAYATNEANKWLQPYLPKHGKAIVNDMPDPAPPQNDPSPAPPVDAASDPAQPQSPTPAPPKAAPPQAAKGAGPVGKKSGYSAQELMSMDMATYREVRKSLGLGGQKGES